MGDWLQVVHQLPLGWLVLVVVLGALSEYLLPVLPGDTLLAGGTFLMLERGLPWALASIPAVLGCAAGIGLALWAGASSTAWRWLRAVDAVPRTRLAWPWAALVHRFVPGVRGPLLFLLGRQRPVSLAQIFALALVGALLWMAVLMGALLSLERSLDAWEQLAGRLQTAVMAAIALALVGYVAYGRLRKRSVPSAPDLPPRRAAPSDSRGSSER